jgi:hypothetical protein
VPISATSPTLQIARQRALPPPAPAVPRFEPWRIPGAAAIAFAVAVSWLAAVALVIGLVWAASTLAPNPSPQTPPETLPYAIGWSAVSLATIAAAVASLFVADGRRRALTALAATLALALAAVVAGANLLS